MYDSIAMEEQLYLSVNSKHFNVVFFSKCFSSWSTTPSEPNGMEHFTVEFTWFSRYCFTIWNIAIGLMVYPTILLKTFSTYKKIYMLFIICTLYQLLRDLYWSHTNKFTIFKMKLWIYLLHVQNTFKWQSHTHQLQRKN